jgi:hypothetical protein
MSIKTSTRKKTAAGGRARADSSPRANERIYAGIDPGLGGAIAVLDQHGRFLEAYPTPVITTTRAGKPSRREYDLVAIRELLASLASRNAFVALERPTPMPHEGTIANYHRGVSNGWAWALTMLGIPHELVSPQVWQKTMHAGTARATNKQRSIVAVRRLFPNANLKRSAAARNLTDHNLAEATLLAEYIRRKLSGLSMELASGVDLAREEAATSATLASAGDISDEQLEQLKQTGVIDALRDLLSNVLPSAAD